MGLYQNRIVVKVGTSTLTNEVGKTDLRAVDRLVCVLSDIQNMGYEVILVSSGAIAVGSNKLNLKSKPTSMRMKQAAEAVGQCSIMFLYDKFFGDNDMLSSVVAVLCKAKRLVILSDINGLYDSDPRLYPNANLISKIEKIDESVYALAGGAGSKRGTGGMKTKLQAASLATSNGIDTIITNGKNPEDIYKIINGKSIGTLFTGIQ